MANFKTSLLALVGKGAQKRNVEKYARSVKKAYQKQIDKLEEEIEEAEDTLEDLTTHAKVNIKTGAGTTVADATNYVEERIKGGVLLAELKVELKIAKKAFEQDFPRGEVDLGSEEIAAAATSTETED